MTRVKIGLIHTSNVLVPLFTELCNELMPHVETVNIADDVLIKDTMEHGALSTSVSNRLNGHIKEAEDAGVEAIMVTCSSLGPAVDASQKVTQVPLYRVDEAMADQAIAMGKRIGVIATVSTTLRPTAELIERRAQASGNQVEVVIGLCDGALEKLLSGDVDTHDRMVIQKLREMIPHVDVIVLAQASMARVIGQLEDDIRVPILSSPRLAIESLAKRMRESA